MHCDCSDEFHSAVALAARTLNRTDLDDMCPMLYGRYSTQTLYKSNTVRYNRAHFIEHYGKRVALIQTVKTYLKVLLNDFRGKVSFHILTTYL